MSFSEQLDYEDYENRGKDAEEDIPSDGRGVVIMRTERCDRNWNMGLQDTRGRIMIPGTVGRHGILGHLQELRLF